MSTRVGWVCLAAMLLAGGCREPDSAAGPELIKVPDDVRSASEHVAVSGATLSVDAELWRDFMPMSPPSGKPLALVFSLFSADSIHTLTIPEVDRCWVVRGDSAWASTPSKEPEADVEADSVLVRYGSAGGPLWGPGEYVDVVVRLTTAQGERLLVRAPHRLIGKTQ